MKTNGRISWILMVVFISALVTGCQLVATPMPGMPTLAPPTPLPSSTPAERVVTLLPQATAERLPSATPLPPPTNTPEPAALSLVYVNMLDAQHGWAEDDQGRVYKTQTGGETWQDVSPTALFSTATFLDGQTALGIEKVPVGQPMQQMTTWQTTDGGQTWTSHSWGPLDPLVGEGGPVQLIFLDAQHGWAYFQIYPGMNHCETAIYQTADAGVTWQQVEISPFTNQGTLNGAYDTPYGHHIVTFLNQNLGFAGNGKLMATFDGGHDWREQSLAQPANFPKLDQPYTYVSPPWFTSDQDGVLFERVYAFNDVALPPGDIFGAAPKAAYLYVTHNGGETWQPYSTPALVGWPDFLDANSGWFLGSDNPAAPTPTGLWQTSDGGKTWQVLAKETPLPLGSKISFVSQQVGFAFNPNKSAAQQLIMGSQQSDIPQTYLYRTQDGGKTWQLMQPVKVDR